MAVVKHKTSKNASYADVLEYYTYKHQEDQQTGHYEPVLDEKGLLQKRDNYAVAYINARGQEDAPERWVTACIDTNLAWQKNQEYDDRKNHEYIISHPAEDHPKMSMEDLMEEGKAFARRYLQGYDVLLAVHRDTDNDHIHITCNSVRALERDEQDWMMRTEDGNTLRCETAAGMKHQNSPELLRDCQEWLLEYTASRGLTPEDNNAAADRHRAERYAEKNLEMKEQILSLAQECKNLSQLQERLRQEYDTRLIRRGKTLSVLPPGRKKPIRLTTIGLTPEELYRSLDHGKYSSPDVTPPQMEEQSRKTEERKYVEWLRERRSKNAEKAENTIALSQAIIVENLHAAGVRYEKSDFQELNLLVNKTAYLVRDLQTEADKLDALIDRWEQYKNPELPDEVRKRQGSYIRWCGLDPDSALEFEDLVNEREAISIEMNNLADIRDDLLKTAAEWRGMNDVAHAEQDLKWTVSRKALLKNQLKECRAARKKLGKIADNCQRAAFRKINSREMQEKANRFYNLRTEKVLKEHEIKRQLQAIKEKERLEKQRLKNIKIKEQEIGR